MGGRVTGMGKGLDNPLSAAIAERDADVISMVDTALKSGNACLAYQPIMQARDPSKPAFYEGLIRILDPTGRVIPAAEFIEEVEDTELGRQIDCLALQIGMQTLAEVPGLRLSINMSARSIGYRAWMDTLEVGLRLGPTVAERLILEITESSAMQMPDVTRAFMSELQHKGITFALDDFGAGYTSFRYLRDFYFDLIKIDKHFIQNIHKSPDNQVLVEALISIGRHFEMFTVAEFVQSPEEADFLIDAGIDCLQGYYYGVPTIHPAWTLRSQSRKAG